MPLLEIQTVGDAVFVSRILNATAMLANDGLFVGLGTIGALIGLFALGIKGIASQKIDFSGWAAGIVVWLVMFVPRADVAVSDVAPAFGREAAADIRVDNIPLGVAAMGWAVSNISSALSAKMTQAMSWPGFDLGFDEAGGTRAVELLAALRTMGDPQQESMLKDDDGSYRLLNMNLSAYIARCVEMEVASDPSRISTMLSQPNPMDTSRGFGSTDAWIGVDQWRQDAPASSGAPPPPPVLEAKSCAQASTDLTAALADPGLTRDVLSSLAPVVKIDSQSIGEVESAATTLVRSAATKAWAGNAALAGEIGQAMQKYVAAHVVHGALMKTLASSNANNQLMSLNMMLGDSMAQRNTQYVAEESMFLQMARPVSAFFESMIYICAPFMAFALGLGSFGLSLTLRYSLLTLWVMLWGPTLAAINLFQVTMAEHAFEAVLKNYDNAAVSTGSLSTAVHLAENAEAWVSIGSLLAASTPAITLMMIFGSAMTAVGLANRLQSADTINEKNNAPDAVSVGAANQVAALAQTSVQQGTRLGGADAAMPTFTLGSSQKLGIGSSNTWADSTLQDWTRGAGREAMNALQADIASGAQVSSKDLAELKQEQGIARRLMNGVGIDTRQMDEKGVGLVQTTAASIAGGANIDPTMAAGAAVKTAMAARVAAIKAANAGSKSQQSEAAIRDQASKELAGSMGMAIGGHLRAEDREEAMTRQLASLGQTVANRMDRDAGFKNAVVGSISNMAETFSKQSGTETNRTAGTAKWEQRAQEAQKNERTFREEAAYENRVGSGQQLPLTNASQAIAGAPAEQRRALMEQGMAALHATEAGQERYAKGVGIAMALGLRDPEQARAAGLLLALTDNVPTAPMANAEDQKTGALAAFALMSQTGMIASNTGALGQDPLANRGVGAEAPEFGATRKEVNEANPGASMTPAQIRAQALSISDPLEAARFIEENGGQAATNAANRVLEQVGGGSMDVTMPLDPNSSPDFQQAQDQTRSAMRTQVEDWVDSQMGQNADASLAQSSMDRSEIAQSPYSSPAYAMTYNGFGPRPNSVGDGEGMGDAMDRVRGTEFSGNWVPSDDAVTVMAAAVMATEKKLLSAEQYQAVGEAFDRLEERQPGLGKRVAGYAEQIAIDDYEDRGTFPAAAADRDATIDRMTRSQGW